MIVMDDYQEVKRRVAKLQREADEAAGELKALRARMRKEFGVDTLKTAKELLRKLTSDEVKLAADWNTALAAFKQQYKGLLDERKDTDD